MLAVEAKDIMLRRPLLVLHCTLACVLTCRAH